MRQWVVLYKKEMREMCRNFKWIWVPLVFILLGIMQPVTFYFLPEILQGAGNIPAGSIIEMPLPSGGEVMMQTISQYGIMGLLIIVLSMMSVVSGERNSGVIELILVKPVSYTKFITAKWAGMLTITAVSFLLSYAGAWYYTEQLIGEVDFLAVIYSFLLYLLWLFFIVSITLLMSTLFRSMGATAFVTLGIVAILTICTGLFNKVMTLSPSRLSDFAGQWVMGIGSNSDVPLVGVIIITILCIAACVGLAVYGLHKKQSLS